jgi:long-chain acyl-CoA synthetase
MTARQHKILDPSIIVPGDTIARMFWNAAQKRRDKICLRQKAYGIWQAQTYGDVAQIAREIGQGLIALGFEPGQRASILSNTIREWLYADLGILCAGGVSNGIYPTDSVAQAEYLMQDSSSLYIFLEDEEQLDKILEVRENLPLLRKIIVFKMEGLHALNDEQVISLDTLRTLGRTYEAADPARAAEWERRIDVARPEDLAILVYTSGTTGKPKGAMISHKNIITAIRGFNQVLPQHEEDERMCFLPLCHVAERLAGAYFALYVGARLNFVENPETVPENVREIAPTVFLAVPRIWEKFYSGVMIALSEGTMLEKFAYQKAIGIGRKSADYLQRGEKPPLALGVLFWLARLLVLNNVRKSIGIHRCRYLATGAAPISPDLIRWYMALGVPMLEVWGMTETTAGGTANPPSLIKPGSIGIPAPFNEIRLDPATSEILVRGDNVFMGYLNQPDKTAETIDADGWLHTGDVGSVDNDGYFKITDRMKDIIITAGGKNITPSELENELKFSPYITDAVVIGDKRPYLVCLIMIDQDNVEKFAQDHDIPFSNYVSLCRAPEIQHLVESELKKVNEKFARVEQIKKFRLIEQKLTAEDDELTPTMKLKRKLVNQKYAPLIESMYQEA